MPTDPRRFLPLRPVELLVLVALAEEEAHGYGLTQSIADRTDGAVRLEPGNLYKVLKRLAADGLIQASGRRPVSALDDERRRYYRLTRLGERVAAAEAARLRALVSLPAIRTLTERFGSA